jgi:hypothetical protein
LIQNDKTMLMHLYFSDIFKVSPKVLDKYGAFNISLVTGLPLLRKDSGRAGMTGKMTRIDEMVYALYGLTPEEIAIVEGKR